MGPAFLVCSDNEGTSSLSEMNQRRPSASVSRGLVDSSASVCQVLMLITGRDSLEVEAVQRT